MSRRRKRSADPPTDEPPARPAHGPNAAKSLPEPRPPRPNRLFLTLAVAALLVWIAFLVYTAAKG